MSSMSLRTLQNTDRLSSLLPGKDIYPKRLNLSPKHREGDPPAFFRYESLVGLLRQTVHPVTNHRMLWKLIRSVVHRGFSCSRWRVKRLLRLKCTSGFSSASDIG